MLRQLGYIPQQLATRAGPTLPYLCQRTTQGNQILTSPPLIYKQCLLLSHISYTVAPTYYNPRVLFFFQQNTKRRTNAGKQSKGTNDRQKRKAGAKNAVIMHYSLHVVELRVLSNISGRRLEVIFGSPDASRRTFGASRERRVVARGGLAVLFLLHFPRNLLRHLRHPSLFQDTTRALGLVRW